MTGPVGIFDSGVGGLTVFRAVERAAPGEALVYYGDTARVPYGTRSPDTVVRYALEAAEFLRQRRVRLLVVACNTASSVALEPLGDAVAAPVVGVIEPGARRAVEATRNGRIGVIGTRATVASRAYETRIRALEPAAEVVAAACPLFVPLAEEGWADDSVTVQIAERYLDPLRRAEVDTLVLGCTHYPLLHDTIARVMGPDVTLVDSAEAVAADVADRLADEGPEARPAEADDTAAAHHFFVTDVPEPFRAVAERFLGRPIERIEHV